MSKHFGGGLPISAVCTTPEIAARAVKSGYFATRSHAGDPLLCAAGEESINIVVEEDMAASAARIEKRIKAALAELAAEFELIGDVRGRGVLIGIEFVTDRRTKAPANDAVRRITDHCLEKGLIFQLRGVHGDLNVIRLVPPMVTSDAEVDRAMAILRDAVRRVSRGRAGLASAAE
jgi:2,2-dialkylglycine decarboxylase (pyruvate)